MTVLSHPAQRRRVVGGAGAADAPRISRTALVVGGVLVGAGIGAMHYIGMEASQWAPIMRFDPGALRPPSGGCAARHCGPVGAIWTGAGGSLAGPLAESGGGCGHGAGHCGHALRRDGGIAFYRRTWRTGAGCYRRGWSLAWRWPLWPWSSGAGASLSTSACATGRCSCRCNRASPACAPLPTRPWTAW